MSVLVCPTCGDLCDAADAACLGCGSRLHLTAENLALLTGRHCAVCILDTSDSECPCCGARLRVAAPTAKQLPAGRPAG